MYNIFESMEHTSHNSCQSATSETAWEFKLYVEVGNIYIIHMMSLLSSMKCGVHNLLTGVFF